MTGAEQGGTRPPARLVVGVVGAPHGIRGEVRVKCFTEDPAALGRYGPLTSTDGRVRVEIAALRPLKDDLVVVRLKGVTTREAAAALTGTTLHLDRSALPEAGEEEFYHADLVGLAARLPDGTALGRVVAVQNHGAGDLLEIARDGADTLLIAFTRAFVPVIDVAGGRVVVSREALADEEDEPEPDAAP